MSLPLKLTAQVDLAEMRKQLAARQLDAGVQDTVAAQQERLKRLEAQLEAMQGQQGGQSSGHAPASPPSNSSSADLQTLLGWAAQGNAKAQFELGYRYNWVMPIRLTPQALTGWGAISHRPQRNVDFRAALELTG